MSGATCSAVDHQASSQTGSSRLMATPTSCSTVEWSCRVTDAVGCPKNQKRDFDACSPGLYRGHRSPDYPENQHVTKPDGVRSLLPADATFYHCSQHSTACENRYTVDDAFEYLDGDLIADDIVPQRKHHKEVVSVRHEYF